MFLLLPWRRDSFSFSSPRRILVGFLPHIFYPLLTLPAGCTTQACGFKDIYPDFASLNYEVYCLSADSPTVQTKWQAKVFHFPLSLAELTGR